MIATEHHAKVHGEKPWRYVLVPDDAVENNTTLPGLLSSHVVAPDAELKKQFELTLNFDELRAVATMAVRRWSDHAGAVIAGLYLHGHLPSLFLPLRAI